MPDTQQAYPDCGYAINGKTPWNPSQTATARVRTPLVAPTFCTCCGSESGVSIKHHSDVYGRVYGDWPWMYQCSDCDARVGMHPFTNIPLGTLASKELRDARMLAKDIFEKLFKEKHMTRNAAYAALSVGLGKELEATHFGWFNEADCQEAQWVASTLLNRCRRTEK